MRSDSSIKKVLPVWPQPTRNQEPYRGAAVPRLEVTVHWTGRSRGDRDKPVNGARTRRWRQHQLAPWCRNQRQWRKEEHSEVCYLINSINVDVRF